MIAIILTLILFSYFFNKNYEKILRGISRISLKKVNKINQKNESKNKKYKQNSLAPKLLEGDDLKKIQPYIDRLDESVRINGVNNVALMSSYGAGKSTILRNFENIHNEYNYLNLSLGSYSTKDHEEFVDENGNKRILDLNEKLENSLVKQMIYREKKSELPYSRFKKINDISKWKIVTLLIIEFLSFISFLFLKDFLNLQFMLKEKYESVSENIEIVNFFCYLIFLTGIFVLFYIVTNAILKQFKLSKLSVGNVSIEGNETNISYFNKYIDEILYYFEVNKFNVVVIEDVDRFGSIKVFEHLKELNILLNNSKQINRNITFIYALKEDIFSKIEEGIEEHESELRTKFFELIIPVIPVLDGFNSRDYLMPLLVGKEKERIIEKIKKESVGEVNRQLMEELIKKIKDNSSSDLEEVLDSEFIKRITEVPLEEGIDILICKLIEKLTKDEIEVLIKVVEKESSKEITKELIEEIEIESINEIIKSFKEDSMELVASNIINEINTELIEEVEEALKEMINNELIIKEIFLLKIKKEPINQTIEKLSNSAKDNLVKKTKITLINEVAKNYTLENEFKVFLGDISLHIQDLRILNNIVNEYYTFIDVHGDLSGSFDKKRLFSLITLKNLIPSVYTELQKSEGILYKVIATDEFDYDLIDPLKEKLKYLEQELNEIEDEISIDKLSTGRLFFFENRFSNEDKIKIDNEWYELSQVTIDLIEKAISSDSPNEIESYSNRYGYSSLSKNGLLQAVREPRRILQSRLSEKNNEVNELRNEISSFQRSSLQHKISKNLISIDNLFISSNKDSSKKQEKAIDTRNDDRLEVTNREKDLLLFLITNGYLDEDYSSYLSIFYEGTTLTASDKNLLVKLKSNQSIEFDEDIFDSSVVVGNLSIKDFERPGILNVNMFLYLFSNNYKDKDKIRDVVLKNWFNQNENIYFEQLDVLLSKERISKLIFKMVELFGVDFYIKSKESMKSQLVNLILSSIILEESYFGYQDGTLLNNILNDAYFNDEPEPEYLLKENIISRPHFFSEMENYIEKSKLIESFASFNNNDETYDDAKILFEDIDMGDLNGQEFKLFIELELFDFNEKIFESILNYGENEMVKEVSYENILQMENQDLITNVQDNLDAFIRDVLLELEVLHETEESFIEMLNLYDEEDAEYIRYGELISRANTKIFDISRIKNQKLWNKIFEFEKYKLNWVNLMTFKTSEKVDLEYLRIIFNDSSIIPHLKSDYEQFSDITKSDTKNLLKGLVDKKIIDVNENNLEILKLSKYEAYHLDAASVKFLISNDLVVFDIETLDEFRGFDLKDKLLLNYPDEYIVNANDITLTVNEINGLIKGWDKSDLLRLINLLFNKEFPELFVDQKFIDTLLSEQIIITDEQMNKLINLNSSIDSVQKYFIFNINKGMLEQETIDTVLATIYETSINTLTSDDFEMIFSQTFDSELFVKYLNFAFRKFEYSSEEYETIESWLKTQKAPFNQLYINKRTHEIILEKNSSNEELIKKLIEIGIVSSSRDKEPEKLSVYVKQNKPESKVEVKLL
ncbi:hypothetical protein VBH15_08305 [Vagococcus fluvialis]|uniref:YobI family P-loop NTPase n=1 Tax=Vagococcus fluvialis TaxID=2738 RepID=UPI0037D19443